MDNEQRFNWERFRERDDSLDLVRALGQYRADRVHGADPLWSEEAYFAAQHYLKLVGQLAPVISRQVAAVALATAIHVSAYHSRDN